MVGLSLAPPTDARPPTADASEPARPSLRRPCLRPSSPLRGLHLAAALSVSRSRLQACARQPSSLRHRPAGAVPCGCSPSLSSCRRRPGAARGQLGRPRTPPSPPSAAALTRAGRRHVVALAGEWAGGGGLVSADPRRVLRPKTSAAAFAVADRLPAVEGEGLGDVPVGVPEGDVARARVGSGPVGGGWFGYLGFGLADALWRSPPPLPATRLLPMAHWAWHDWVLRLDPDGAWWFEALVGVGLPRGARGRGPPVAGGPPGGSSRSGRGHAGPGARPGAAQRRRRGVRAGDPSR